MNTRNKFKLWTLFLTIGIQRNLAAGAMNHLYLPKLTYAYLVCPGVWHATDAVDLLRSKIFPIKIKYVVYFTYFRRKTAVGMQMYPLDTFLWTTFSSLSSFDLLFGLYLYLYQFAYINVYTRKDLLHKFRLDETFYLDKPLNILRIRRLVYPR